MLPVGLFLLFLAAVFSGRLEKNWEKKIPERGDCSVCGTVKDIRWSGEHRILLLETEQNGIWNVYLQQEQEVWAEALQPGWQLLVQGTVKSYEAAANPGQFDAARYYLGRHITAYMYASALCVTGRRTRYPAAWFYRMRRGCEQTIAAVCRSAAASTAFPLPSLYTGTESMLNALLLGERSSLETDLKRLYTDNGIAHILAVSGLHVSILGGGLFWLLRHLRMTERVAGIGTVLGMGLYIGMIGSPVSAIRAWLFFLLLQGSRLLLRRRDMLTACLFSAAVMTAVQPFYLQDAGFWLSFSAVTGLCVLYPLAFPETQAERYPVPGYPAVSLLDKLGRFLKQRLQGLKQILAAGLFLQLTMLPIMARFYYEINWIGLLLNPVVLPLMPLLLGSACAALAVGFLLPGLPGIESLLLLPCSEILKLYEGLCRLADTVTRTRHVIGQPTPVQIVLYYLFLFCGAALSGAVRRNVGSEVPVHRIGQTPTRGRLCTIRSVCCRGIRSRAWILCVIPGLFLLQFHPTSAVLTVSFLDIGQGDCIVFQLPEADITGMIDCGSSDVKRPAADRLIPYLKSQGIDTLNYIFVTHPDEDHINGIRELLQEKDRSLSVENLFLTPQTVSTEKGVELAQLAAQQRIAVRLLAAGDRIRIGKVLLQCLYPYPDTGSSDTNNLSLVLSLTCGSFLGIFPGDLEMEGEQNILRELEQRDTRFCVLKVGHHGSSGSSGEAFLQVLRPQIGIISCGQENIYGHPHEETLERLRRVGTRILRTDQDGWIQLQTDGKKMTIRSFL